MHKLFYTPGACSMAAHIVLEELGLPYEAMRVDLKSHTANGNDYYKINPSGSVPALVLEDGSLLTQNIAILSYLGNLDKQHHLMPKAGTMEWVRCLEWLGFINSDLHKAFGSLFKLDSLVTSESAKAELKQNLENNVKKMMTLADKKLKPQGFAMGEQFSIIDAYLFVMFQWAKFMQFPVTAWPNYTALAERISQRPAVQRALQKEGLA